MDNDSRNNDPKLDDPKFNDPRNKDPKNYNTKVELKNNKHNVNGNSAYVIVDPLTPDINQPSWCKRKLRFIKLFYICIVAILLLTFVLFQAFASRNTKEITKNPVPTISYDNNKNNDIVDKNNDNNNNKNNENNNEKQNNFDNTRTASMEKIWKFIKNLHDPNDLRLLSKYINHRELTADETRRLETLRKELNLYDSNEQTNEQTTIPVLYRRRRKLE